MKIENKEELIGGTSNSQKNYSNLKFSAFLLPSLAETVTIKDHCLCKFPKENIFQQNLALTF